MPKVPRKELVRLVIDIAAKVVVITGASSGLGEAAARHLSASPRRFDLLRAEVSELNSAIRTIAIRGQRLPDAVLVFSDVEAPAKKP